MGRTAFVIGGIVVVLALLAVLGVTIFRAEKSYAPQQAAPLDYSREKCSYKSQTDRYYVSKDLNVCAHLEITCKQGEKLFYDEECGCGCERKSEFAYAAPVNVLRYAQEHDANARLIRILVSNDTTEYTFVGLTVFDVIVIEGQEKLLFNTTETEPVIFRKHKTLISWNVNHAEALKTALGENQSFEGDVGSASLVHVPKSSPLHGGDEFPKSLTNPAGLFWQVTFTEFTEAARGLVVFIDALNGGILFTTEYALK